MIGVTGILPTLWRSDVPVIPPKVEYSLMDMGRKFHPVIEALQHWGQEYIDYLKNGKE